MIDCSEPTKLSLQTRIELFLNNKLNEGQSLELIAELDKKYFIEKPVVKPNLDIVRERIPNYGVSMDEFCPGCSKSLIYTFASGPACQYSQKEKWGKTGCGTVSKYNALAPIGSKMPGTKTEN